MNEPVSFFTSATLMLLALIAACILSSCLSGCAGTAADKDFRSKVSRVDHATKINSDPAGNLSAESDWSFELREPAPVQSTGGGVRFLKNGCMVYAAEFEAQKFLSGSGWAKLLTVTYRGCAIGHAFCIFAIPNGDLWAYDCNSGSRPLLTRDRSIAVITARLQRFDHRIASAAFVE